jgi:hypothetical protein
VGSYDEYYGQPWYYLTEISCEVSEEQAALIDRLTTNWRKWISENFHQNWPHNCRAYVAYVLFEILKQDPNRVWPGLGSEPTDEKRMNSLKSFVEKNIMPPLLPRLRKRKTVDELG